MRPTVADIRAMKARQKITMLFVTTLEEAELPTPLEWICFYRGRYFSPKCERLLEIALFRSAFLRTVWSIGNGR